MEAKHLALMAAVCVAAVALSGCTGVGPKEASWLSVQGSTTVMPLAQKAAEAYMDAHPDADIAVSAGGSGVGVTAAGEGTAGIGMSSRDLKTDERAKYPALVEHVVARDAIAVVVHAGNGVPSLTLEQVKAIYRGNATNWREVGGPDLPIVAIGRDAASGTREFFFEHVMKKEDFAPGVLEMNSNGAVRQQVAQTPGAVGYVSMGYLDGSVRAVPVERDGRRVDATVANVLSGDYPIARRLLMLTRGEPEGLAADYLRFVVGAEGQALAEEEGFVRPG